MTENKMAEINIPDSKMAGNKIEYKRRMTKKLQTEK